MLRGLIRSCLGSVELRHQGSTKEMKTNVALTRVPKPVLAAYWRQLVARFWKLPETNMDARGKIPPTTVQERKVSGFVPDNAREITCHVQYFRVHCEHIVLAKYLI